MPDLFDDPFTDPFSAIRDVPPARGSAADARRRGDRLRRRRTATVLAGSALALALTVGGVAWSQAGVPSTSPDPAAPSPSVTAPAPTPSEPAPSPSRTPDDDLTLTPQPAQGAPTAIAADFPLADGWPEADGEELELQGPSPRQAAFDAAVVCGATRDLRPAGGVERLGARLMGITFGGDRLLVTFPDVAEAEAAQDRAVAGLSQCPPSPTAAGGEEVLVSEIEPVGLGDEAVRVTMGSQVAGAWTPEATIYHVVRQGNALLLAYQAGEGAGGDGTIASKQRTAERALGGVIAAMCVYRDGAC